MGLYKRGWDIEADIVIHGGCFGGSVHFCRDGFIHIVGNPHSTNSYFERGMEFLQCELTQNPRNLPVQVHVFGGFVCKMVV